MKKKILILSLYPAPYRAELYEYFSREFEIDVFFESDQGDGRNQGWFTKGSYQFLDTEKGVAYYKKAIRNLKEYQLVVLYEYSSKEAIKLIAKCKRKKVPYVINCDGVILPHKKNFLKDVVKRWLLSKATAYMASGQHAKEYFLHYGAKEEKIYIHHFSTLHEQDILTAPIEADEKIVLREKLGLPIDKKIAIAVGRFIPLKRYDYLLREWKRIDEECCLLLIGGGDEYEKYQAIIQEQGLKNVIVENFHPPEELYEYYKAADVFIHPTSYDVWGLVINEAMAKGIPVVVSNTCVAGLELVKEWENGFLFPMGEETIGVDKLLSILQDDKLRAKMAEKCLKTIQEYTVENMAKTHMGIFEKVLKNER